MTIQDRISAFHDLGQFFLNSTDSKQESSDKPNSKNASNDAFQDLLKKAEIKNPWFTPDNLNFCLKHWGKLLTIENLENWLCNQDKNPKPKKIGIIPAGNIPLVGFHDLMAVLITGHQALIKPSSKDEVLMDFVIDFLSSKNEAFKTQIQKTERLKGYDAVIATGSNNTARYFEHYFKNVPHIIRKNRTGVAVLNGDESAKDLKNLSDDIFRYFGLGCRNVTKLYLPENFDTNRLFESFFDWNPIIHHNKYSNNYDYNRAIFLMEQIPFLDNHFLILKESTELHSPIGVVHYQFYKDSQKVLSELNDQKDQIQCIVGHGFGVGFGESQKPGLTDYADQIDTLSFLSNLDK